MKKTTVYLPDDLKKRLEWAAAATGRSEADLIRAGVEAVVDGAAPEPRGPLFSSGDPTWAERDEELLEGFGED